jgi:hypothetical protein
MAFLAAAFLTAEFFRTVFAGVRGLALVVAVFAVGRTNLLEGNRSIETNAYNIPYIRFFQLTGLPE